MCPGAGGGAKGFNKGSARVGLFEAAPRCIGGIDNDAAGLEDFERVAGVRGTLRDLFTVEQFTAFHGRAPSADYREVTPDDVRAAAGGERPQHTRDDVIAEILLAVTERRLAEADIEKRIGEFTRAHYRDFDSRFGDASLDAERFDGRGRTLHDTVSEGLWA